MHSKHTEKLMQQTCKTTYSIEEDDSDIVFDDRGNIFIKPKPDVNPYEHSLGIGDNVGNVVMANKYTEYRFKSYRRKIQ